MEVPKPRPGIDGHPDYQIICEEAIEDAVRELIDRVIIAGWKPEVAFAAVSSVAHSLGIAYAEDPDPAPDRAAEV